MIRDPAALALVGTSVLGSGLLAAAAAASVGILRRWDLSSGAPSQLALERRTALVGTIVATVLAFEVGSVFFLVATADRLASLFTGAMCAAGTLQVNGWGYPALLAKLLGAVLGGIWLVLNRADARGYDQPLVRAKSAFLLVLFPIVGAGAALQAAYFLALRPDVVTSCCGSLFGADAPGLGGALGGLPPRPAGAFLLLCAGGALVAGLLTGRARAAGPALAAFSAAALPAVIAGTIAWVSPYVYELPDHHCPFCLLRAESGSLGWPLWVALLAGVVAGVGAGVVHPLRRIPSLAEEAPRLERRLARSSAVAFAVVLAVVAWAIWTSALHR